jgi:hypothetical protein
MSSNKPALAGRHWISNLPIKIAIDMKRIHNALRDPEWPDIDIIGVRDAYKTILEQCVSQTPFQQAKTADERRRVLYRLVVRPLKELLKDLKWLDDPVAPVKEVNRQASYIKGPSEFLSHQAGYVLVSYFRSRSTTPTLAIIRSTSTEERR